MSKIKTWFAKRKPALIAGCKALLSGFIAGAIAGVGAVYAAGAPTTSGIVWAAVSGGVVAVCNLVAKWFSPKEPALGRGSK